MGHRRYWSIVPGIDFLFFIFPLSKKYAVPYYTLSFLIGKDREKNEKIFSLLNKKHFILKIFFIVFLFSSRYNDAEFKGFYDDPKSILMR